MSRRRAAALVAMAIGGVGLAALGLTPGEVRDEPTPVASSATRAFWTTYREATRRRSRGDLDGAVAAYQRALALRPDHEDSLYYLGNCQLERRAYAEAVDAYRRLVNLNPEGSPRAYVQWGLVHASLDAGAPRDLAEAERLFTRAVGLDPESGAVLGLAEVALLKGDVGRAQTWLERADVENASSVAVPFLRGYLAWRRGAGGEAWTRFEAAVARGRTAKPPVSWSEEGDVKADPALRWQALARQSVFGAHWLALRAYLEPPGPSPAVMSREYRRLERVIAGARGPGPADQDARRRRAAGG